MSSPSAQPSLRRRPGAGRYVLAGVALLPVAEIALAVAVAGWIGVGWTLAALAALSLLGIVVLRRAARAAARTLGPRTVAPTVPAAPPVPGASRATGADLALEAAGGVLLTVPGFLTSVAGTLIVLPPTRRVVRPLLGAGAMRLVTSAARRGRVQVVAGEAFDVRVTQVHDLDDRGAPTPAAPRAITGEVVMPERPAPPAG